MKISKVSMLSGKLNEMDLPITKEQLDDWKLNGKKIQEVFPNLKPAQREFLMTGITDSEWKRAFGEED